MKEHWKENRTLGVMVSDQGRVRKLRNGALCEPFMNKGRYYVTIYPIVNDSRKCKLMSLPRLVLMTWEPLSIKHLHQMTVDHRNRDVSDNRLCNLEWCSYAENQRRNTEYQLTGKLDLPDKKSIFTNPLKPRRIEVRDQREPNRTLSFSSLEKVYTYFLYSSRLSLTKEQLVAELTCYLQSCSPSGFHGYMVKVIK